MDSELPTSAMTALPAKLLAMNDEAAKNPRPYVGKKRGRKPGIASKMNRETQRVVAATGITPLEYMLKVMRNRRASDARRDWAAAAAAPYVHPRLATVQTHTHITGHLTLEQLVSATLDQTNREIGGLIEAEPVEQIEGETDQ